MTWIENNAAYLLIGLAVAVVVLFILCIVLFVKFSGQKKRYDYFMGANRRPSHNLEMKIEEYFETSKQIEEKYSKLLDMVTDMDKTDKTKIQKVGLIRYNPFDEMGGNLCFALALLDGYDNGVVLNGIHSRTGSFTYAKPIEMGVSTYMLSEEEIKAVEMAKNHAYEPEHEKVVKEMTEQHKKATEEANKLHKAQNETLQKANVALQEQLKTQGKTLNDLQEQQKKQQGEFNKSLGQMQETNKGLQASVSKMTNELMAAKQRVTELEGQKPNNTGYIVVIIVLIILAALGFIM